MDSPPESPSSSSTTTSSTSGQSKKRKGEEITSDTEPQEILTQFDRDIDGGRTDGGINCGAQLVFNHHVVVEHQDAFMRPVLKKLREHFESEGVMRFGITTTHGTPDEEIYRNLPSTLTNGGRSDFTIACNFEGVSFAVHKCVLAHKSEFFRAMFDAGMKEANESRMEIDSSDTIAATEMELLLNYFYMPNDFVKTFERIITEILVEKNARRAAAAAQTPQIGPILDQRGPTIADVSRSLPRSTEACAILIVDGLITSSRRYLVDKSLERDIVNTCVVGNESYGGRRKWAPLKTEPAMSHLLISKHGLTLPRMENRVLLSCCLLNQLARPSPPGSLMEETMKAFASTKEYQDEMKRLGCIFAALGRTIESLWKDVRENANLTAGFGAMARNFSILYYGLQPHQIGNDSNALAWLSSEVEQSFPQEEYASLPRADAQTIIPHNTGATITMNTNTNTNTNNNNSSNPNNPNHWTLQGTSALMQRYLTKDTKMV